MNESVNVADPVIRSSNAVAEVHAAYAKSTCGPDDRLHPDGQTWGIPVADPQLCARFEREHEDPILGRRLQHRYRIVTRPVNS